MSEIDLKEIKIRRWKKTDIPRIVECHMAVYADYPPEVLNAKKIQRIYELQLDAFPEGQYLATYKGRVIGYATSLIIHIDDDQHTYTYAELTGASTFSTHDPAGDSLYGADIGVHPEFRGRGVAGMLYVQRRTLMKKYNLRRMIAYGRLPGYSAHAGKLTAQEYVDQVTAGELKDPALTAHLKAGYKVKRVLINFFPDLPSMNYSTMLEMENPEYNPIKRRISSMPIRKPVRKIRVCAAQFMMRRLSKWEEFEQTVEFFVDSADAYHCHFLLLPEYFTAQLFSTMPPDIDQKEAVARLVKMTDKYISLMKRLAKKRQLYIIGGSHPVRRDGELYNVAHLFTPAGNVYTQDKLHITPTEREEWGVRPGHDINIFDTPLGRIAIQVCYDIEFPEVARILTLAGVETIFVPFSTDERKAYLRVRYTAHARAVENFLYVVTSGNVGNLPTTKNYLINYGVAAVLTPSDFAFPPDGIAAQAEPNIETVVIADLDLTILAHQREMATVRPLHDMRHDLYELTAKVAPKIINVE